MRHIGFAFALLASALPAGFTNAQVRPGEPHNLLRTQVGLSESELADMDGGKGVTKVLDMK
ncbi:MAG TPA: hypothetical protein VEK15_28020, partial [Vicinamibacteria bacterium]|nr:hypothetical protein [Vicinamibacteria bacterium]